MELSRRHLGALGLATLATLAARVPADAAADDPLPSWNDGPVKQAILGFVARTTTPGPGFVPATERIATFDNDGTLWCEQPIYVEAAFALERARELAKADPALAARPAFKTVVAGDPAAIGALTEKELVELVLATHTNLTDEAFIATVKAWLATARHPRFGRPYTELVYQPQLELLAFLRANGFKTFIVSGGGVDFMRAFAEAAYGVPPEQVIGSSGKTSFQLDGETASLFKLPEIGSVDDGPGKPQNIGLVIGRRPVVAVGNSDGDLPMLQYATGGARPALALLVHHDDAAREYAYDRASKIGTLDKAWDEATRRGWPLISMRRDWKQIFPARRATKDPKNGAGEAIRTPDPNLGKVEVADLAPASASLPPALLID